MEKQLSIENGQENTDDAPHHRSMTTTADNTTTTREQVSSTVHHKYKNGNSQYKSVLVSGTNGAHCKDSSAAKRRAQSRPVSHLVTILRHLHSHSEHVAALGRYWHSPLTNGTNSVHKREINSSCRQEKEMNADASTEYLATETGGEHMDKSAASGSAAHSKRVNEIDVSSAPFNFIRTETEDVSWHSGAADSSVEASMRELGITRDDTMGDGKKQNNDDTTGCNPAQVEEAIALRAVVREQAELIQRLAAFAEAYMRRKHAEAIAEYTSCHRCGRAEPLQDQHGMNNFSNPENDAYAALPTEPSKSSSSPPTDENNCEHTTRAGDGAVSDGKYILRDEDAEACKGMSWGQLAVALTEARRRADSVEHHLREREKNLKDAKHEIDRLKLTLLTSKRKLSM